MRPDAPEETESVTTVRLSALSERGTYGLHKLILHFKGGVDLNSEPCIGELFGNRFPRICHVCRQDAVCSIETCLSAQASKLHHMLNQSSARSPSWPPPNVRVWYAIDDTEGISARSAAMPALWMITRPRLCKAMIVRPLGFLRRPRFDPTLHHPAPLLGDDPLQVGDVHMRPSRSIRLAGSRSVRLVTICPVIRRQTSSDIIMPH